MTAQHKCKRTEVTIREIKVHDKGFTNGLGEGNKLVNTNLQAKNVVLQKRCAELLQELTSKAREQLVATPTATAVVQTHSCFSWNIVRHSAVQPVCHACVITQRHSKQLLECRVFAVSIIQKRKSSSIQPCNVRNNLQRKSVTFIFRCIFFPWAWIV